MREMLYIVAMCLVIPTTGGAQTTGTCEHGTATADLDVNNVRAPVFTNGNLFFPGAQDYEIPKGGDSGSIFFVGGISLGAVNPSGQFRGAVTDLGLNEFWPGPLDADGNPPADCTPYDRIFKVSDDDIRAFDRDGTLTDDLRDWPFDLGAPVVDGDGVPGNYNLDGGDRPEVWGDQMLWWVMNDAGNEHQSSGTAPMGMEVQVSALAANGVPGFAGWVPSVANATFYHFRLTNKGQEPLRQMWFGWPTIAHVGNQFDDYAGADTTLRMAYYYNADNFDEGEEGYGTAPPALGFLLPQGPLVDHDGRDNDHDGQIDEPGERLRFTESLIYRGDSSESGNARNDSDDWYKYMQGLWQNGRPMCFGENRYQPFQDCTRTTRFLFPGDPVSGAYWSEQNIDSLGTPNPPGERRRITSSGPFSMNPGDTQDLILAIVWARGTDNLNSITRLRTAAGAVEDALPLITRFDAFPPETPGRNPDATDFYLMRANYPEPFTERTTIRYEIPRAEHVRLAVYDVLGREVARLVDAEQPANVYDVTFDGAGLPGGVYFYRLVTRTVVITRRMAKVR